MTILRIIYLGDKFTLELLDFVVIQQNHTLSYIFHFFIWQLEDQLPKL